MAQCKLSYQLPHVTFCPLKSQWISQTPKLGPFIYSDCSARTNQKQGPWRHETIPVSMRSNMSHPGFMWLNSSSPPVFEIFFPFFFTKKYIKSPRFFSWIQLMEIKCLHLWVGMKLCVLLSVFSLNFRNKKIWLPTQVGSLLLQHPLKHIGTVSFMSVRPDSAPVGPNFRCTGLETTGGP